MFKSNYTCYQSTSTCLLIKAKQARQVRKFHLENNVGRLLNTWLIPLFLFVFYGR